MKETILQERRALSPYCPPSTDVLSLDIACEILEGSNTELINKDDHLYDWN